MRIIIIDDDEITLAGTTSMLARLGYHTTQYTNAEDAYQAVISLNAPVIIILDWMLQSMDGPTFCELVRNTEIDFQPYIIMLTAKASEHDEATALDHGADDFITKPIKSSVFFARLRCAERMISYQQQLHNQYVDMSRLAMFDPLTNIYNRLAGSELVRHDIDKMRRSEAEHGVFAVLDIDHFKTINDQYGHDAGDAVLKALAHRIRNILRESDVFYRFGGEEFVLMSTSSDVEHCEVLLERVRTIVSERVFDIGNSQLVLSISIGAVQFDFENIDGYRNLHSSKDLIETLFKKADENLYLAKRSGRNRLCIGGFNDES